MSQMTDFTLPSCVPGRTLHAFRCVPEGEVRAILQLSHGMVEFIDRYKPQMCIRDSHDDGSVKLIAPLAKVLPGVERAHAVAQQKIGDAGIELLRQRSDSVEIVEDVYKRQVRHRL